MHHWFFYWTGVYITSIMLLNFVIAMMGNVYEKATENHKYIIIQQWTGMIEEALINKQYYG
jgi:hypothetical protein